MDVRQVVLVLSASVLVLVLENIAMTQLIFDDERLEVDRLAIDDDASILCGDSDLRTIVSPLTRLIQRKTADASAAIEYEYEYEYRDAEYEYEENRMAESCRSDPPEPRSRAVLPEVTKTDLQTETNPG